MNDEKKIKAIIGLGNPGIKYYHTRHNIGFRVTDAIVDKYGLSWRTSELFEYANLDENKIVLLKPQTFMNDSGRVLPFLGKQGIKPEEILVVHDELEKEFGKIVLRFGGSHRGHNGLRSIIGLIGMNFWRVRFGIGRPEDREQVSDFVLTNFSQQEEKMVPDLINKAIELIF